MPKPGLRSALEGRRWLHAHEEDSETEMVYRPADHPLPPSRGRDGFELHEDGRCTAIGPGRGDKPEGAPGRWTLDEDDRLEIELAGPRPETASFRIASVSDDRLVIRKPVKTNWRDAGLLALVFMVGSAIFGCPLFSAPMHFLI